MKNYTKQTFKIFWQHTRQHWVSFVVVTFSVIIASLANIIAPLYYKDFFDILSGPGSIDSKPPILVGILIKILLVYAVAWTFWRLATFSISYFETKVMASLSNFCFGYLHKHSVNYFNNNFVGSLVKKVNRFAKAFEGISDALFFEVLQIVTSITFIIYILWGRNKWLGIIILVWITIYCIINYFFSIYKLKYDLKRSQANTEVTAVLADTITNHQNVKLFTGYGRERKLFKKVTEKWRKLQRFCWDLGNIFEAVQALLMIGLEIGIFYSSTCCNREIF